MRIHTEHGNRDVEPVQVIGQYAVHQTIWYDTRNFEQEIDDERWTVTHIASGYAVMTRFSCRSHAVGLARLFKKHVDLDRITCTWDAEGFEYAKEIMFGYLLPKGYRRRIHNLSQ